MPEIKTNKPQNNYKSSSELENNNCKNVEYNLSNKKENMPNKSDLNLNNIPKK